MYSVGKSFGAALKDLAHTLIGVVAAAAVGYLSDPDHLQRLWDALPPWAAAVFPASAAAAFVRNWWKNRSLQPNRRSTD